MISKKVKNNGVLKSKMPTKANSFFRTVPQIKPSIDQKEVDEIIKVVRSTYITEHQATRNFEASFRKMTGAKHVIAVFNATVGLYTALKALGVGPGDEVIVPDLTFVATANSVIMAGAKPVFCDVDLKTFNIDPKEILKKITKKTKVIMPVHLYGQPADMDQISKIAKKYKLFVVEDSAESVGATFNGKYAGTLGDIGVFSFYANKIMTTSEGGLILTNNDDYAERCVILKNHGRVKPGTFIHPHVGFNFKFTDLQAAIGLAQFKKFPRMMKEKEKVMRWYKAGLKEVKEVEFPWIDSRCNPVIWFINILVPNAKELIAHLGDHGVETRSFFPPLHVQPCYSKALTKGKFPNADRLYHAGVSLPSSSSMTKEEVDYVCQGIKTFFASRKRSL
ncbi:MAG: DegT/DnrJ/EryC1/StrS aminotransferase [uncultured bacterium]|nr:MAG: DegT/DnrJ/EryC1/StrS aminotransferase [uncultured bacterium]